MRGLRVRGLKCKGLRDVRGLQVFSSGQDVE